MIDVFLSYCSANRPTAAAIARYLEERGWSIWWDRKIAPGTRYDREIENALDAARCVVVLWTKESINSEWVRDEAMEAHSRRALIPVQLEDIKPPLAFRRTQTIRLFNWTDDHSDDRLPALHEAIQTLLGSRTPSPPPAVPALVPASVPKSKASAKSPPAPARSRARPKKETKPPPLPPPLPPRLEMTRSGERERHFLLHFGDKAHEFGYVFVQGWLTSGTYWHLTLDGNDLFKGNPVLRPFTFVLRDAGAERKVVVEHTMDDSFISKIQQFRLSVDGVVLHTEGF